MPPTLLVGRSVTLTATTTDANGAVLAGRAITWVSSDPLVASITQAGVLTALASGPAAISATSEGKTTAKPLAVSIPEPVVEFAANTPGKVYAALASTGTPQNPGAFEDVLLAFSGVDATAVRSPVIGVVRSIGHAPVQVRGTISRADSSFAVSGGSYTMTGSIKGGALTGTLGTGVVTNAGIVGIDLSKGPAVSYCGTFQGTATNVQFSTPHTGTLLGSTNFGVQAGAMKGTYYWTRTSKDFGVESYNVDVHGKVTAGTLPITATDSGRDVTLIEATIAANGDLAGNLVFKDFINDSLAYYETGTLKGGRCVIGKHSYTVVLWGSGPYRDNGCVALTVAGKTDIQPISTATGASESGAHYGEFTSWFVELSVTGDFPEGVDVPVSMQATRSCSMVNTPPTDNYVNFNPISFPTVFSGGVAGQGHMDPRYILVITDNNHPLP
jgi:hypothetical protein